MITSHTFSGWATTPFEKLTQISLEQYQEFKSHFSFEALRGKTYGRSFCDHFGIADNLLLFTRDPAWCDNYIRKEYVNLHSQGAVI